jgi:hypothetical protein
MMYGNPFSFEEVNRLIALHQSGLTRNQIAAAMGRTQDSVKKKALAMRLLVSHVRPDPWEDERTAELKRLWDEGLSFAAIADELGITRSAVAAKAKRLGLRRKSAEEMAKYNARGEGRAPKSRRAPQTTTRVERIEWTPPPAVPFVPPNPVSLFDVRSFQCRFICSEDKAFPAMFCGEPTLGGSWCSHHRAVVFAPPRMR